MSNNMYQCTKCEAIMERPLYCLVHGIMCPVCGAKEEYIRVIQKVSSD